MNLLLDTHVALWTVTDNARLDQSARALIERDDAEVFVSALTIAEIAIKFSLNRGHPGDMPLKPERALELFQLSGMSIEPLTAEHALLVGRLPFLHRDPFDRLLVAQALAGGYRLVTSDQTVASYSPSIILV